MKFIFVFLLLIIFQTSSYSQQTKGNVEFTSDNLEVDENKNLMIAKGNVIIKSENEVIRADIVKYFKSLDKAIATGDITITNVDGTIYKTSEITLTNEFKDIVALTLFAQFKDNSKIKASKMSKNDEKSIFINGEYTPCECDFKNDEKPIWQLNSSQVTHDKLTKTLHFENVVLRILDYPIFYLPYLTHPDPTVKRKSGLLTPSFGHSSRNGFQFSVPYYFVTKDESWDSTFTNHYKGKNGYINQFNARKKYISGSLETNIFQGEVDTNKQNDDNVFASNIKYNAKLDNNWTVDALGKYTDQDTFMRRYNLDDSSEYKSFIKAEKITRNSISEIQWYKYDNLDLTSKDNQPTIQPSIKHQIFQNGKNFDYRVLLNAHEIKDDEGYDIQRWTGSGQIEKKIPTNFTDFVLGAEAGLDLYAIKDRPSTDVNDNKYLDRLSFGLSILSKKDFLYDFENFDLLITPKLQIISTHSSDRKTDIPNRDSSDYRIDQANLFLINQYQGRDNIQTNQRINFGIDNDLSSDFGDFSFFIGQSQKIGGTQQNNNFLNQNRQSDFIGEMKWMSSNLLNISFNTLLNHHDLENNYSSLEFYGKYESLYYRAIHRSIDKNLTNDNSDREEVQFIFGKKINNWEISYSNKYDLNNNDTELVEEELSIDYVGDYMFQDCLSIKLSYKNKDGAPDRDILPENSVFITLSLKNLGNYGLDSLF
ncbi:MAG: hypothetical protein CMN44_00960 [SAR116 cluster bacterium]|nr:hypothetical protein [SAR116 cluster bacterium]RPH11918.1 MAG: LPS-assembly protein LptD [Alphaproteobacteria bacterium TMED54]